MTQDGSDVPMEYTQRQDTVSISSQNDSESESRDHDAGCESSAVLDRLSDRLQLSQGGGEYCKTCRDAIASAQYALDRALMILSSAHKRSDGDSNGQSKRLKR